jgi:hypothetical protein
VSKAFSISKNTAAVAILLLKLRVTWSVSLIHCSVVLWRARKPNWVALSNNYLASKQAVAYCWHSPAWLFLVQSPIGTRDHIFVLIFNPYTVRQWASSSVRGVGLFNAVFQCCNIFYPLLAAV